MFCYSPRKTLTLFGFYVAAALISLNGVVEAQVREVFITYVGNYKAWVQIPDRPGPFPVVVYNYDEFWDWAGNDMSKKAGYDLKAFMQEFVNWGYICVVPIERYHKINALKGAFRYASQLPQAKSNEIHIVGLSEGAFLSLLVSEEVPKAASLTLICPVAINYSGFFSYPQVVKSAKRLRMPILVMVDRRDKIWKQRMSDVILRILRQEQLPVDYIDYPYPKKWFWNPAHAFMMDIQHFIFNKKHL